MIRLHYQLNGADRGLQDSASQPVVLVLDIMSSEISKSQVGFQVRSPYPADRPAMQHNQFCAWHICFGAPPPKKKVFLSALNLLLVIAVSCLVFQSGSNW